MANELSKSEKTSLTKLEAVIEKGVATFLEVGSALKTIRDEKLYRASHKTFEKYVSERWSLDRTYAHRLIDAAITKQNLLPMGNKSDVINSERQLRELKDVPKEKLGEVIEKAAEIADGTPTAKDLRQAKHEVMETQVSDPPEPAPPPPAKKQSAAELALENARHIQPAQTLLNQLLRVMEDVPDAPGLELYHARRSKLVGMVSPLKGALLACKPYAICPRCNGKKCTQCGNMGWVSSAVNRELSA